MTSDVLSSINALTETNIDVITNIANETDSPSLTSSLQLSSISKNQNKVEENDYLSHKDDLFNRVLQLQNDVKKLKTSISITKLYKKSYAVLC